MYMHTYIATYVFTYTFYVVPLPFVQITFENDTLSNLTIGDPLTLDCTVTAVRGISSSVDIIWTTGGRVVRSVNDTMVVMENDSTIYTDSFEISSLSAIDNGRIYQCTVVINANQPVSRASQIMLNFPGEHIIKCEHSSMYMMINIYLYSLHKYLIK